MAKLSSNIYDITIETPSGEDVGLVAMVSEGKKLYSQEFAPALVNQYATSEISYANLPFEQEIPLAQPDNEQHGGFGQLVSRGGKRYFEGRRTDAGFKGKIIPGPLVQEVTGATLDDKPVAFMQKGSGFYCAAGEKVYKAAGGSLFEVWAGDSVTITDMALLDNAYIALGDDDIFYYSSDMSTFTQATPAASVATLFAKQQNLLWKTVLPNEISYADDPSANPSDWSTAENAGDTSWDITAISIGPSGEVYIGKKDGLYLRDADGGLSQILVAGIRSANNYKNMRYWEGYLFFPLGNGSFFAYDGTTLTDISPSLYAPHSPDFTGRVMAMASDSDWLYFTTKPTTSGMPAILHKGRFESIDGTTDWRDHPIADIYLDDIGAMDVFTPSDDGSPELWIGGEWDSSPKCYRVILPKKYSGVENDEDYRMVTSGYHTTSEFTANLDSKTKAFLSFTLKSENLSSDMVLAVEYQIDADTTWTSLADFDTSPVQTKYFPAGTSGTEIRYRFTLLTLIEGVGDMRVGTWVAGSSTVCGYDTPLATVVLGYATFVRLEGEELQVIDGIFRCADRVILKDGSTKDTRTGDEIWDKLVECKQAGYPVKLWPDAGEGSMYVSLLSPTPKIEFIREDKQSAYERGVWLRMLQAKTS